MEELQKKLQRIKRPFANKKRTMLAIFEAAVPYLFLEIEAYRLVDRMHERLTLGEAPQETFKTIADLLHPFFVESLISQRHDDRLGWLMVISERGTDFARFLQNAR
jgi:hypothetical protein